MEPAKIMVYLTPVIFIIGVALIIWAFMQQKKYADDVELLEIDLEKNNWKKYMGWWMILIFLLTMLVWYAVMRFLVAKNLFDVASALSKSVDGSFIDNITNYVKVLVSSNPTPSVSQVKQIKIASKNKKRPSISLGSSLGGAPIKSNTKPRVSFVKNINPTYKPSGIY